MSETRLLIALTAIVVAVVVMWGVRVVPVQMEHMKCSGFRTQAEAQRSYRAGATWLDGRDRDGVACEALP